MFTPIDYDFVSGKTLSDYNLEVGKFSALSASFKGNVLRLVAEDQTGGELIIHTDTQTYGDRLKLKVKNAKGNATTGEKGNPLISGQYVDTMTKFDGVVIISLNYGEKFEFTGYSLIAG